MLKDMPVTELYVINTGIVEMVTVPHDTKLPEIEDADEAKLAEEADDKDKSKARKKSGPKFGTKVEKKATVKPKEHPGHADALEHEEITSLSSGALAELSFFFRIPAPHTYRVSDSSEVLLFQLTRDAYQKAAMMYPHEAERISHGSLPQAHAAVSIQ
jgi:hypothetical protein